jgi:hypothetical protein
MRPFLVTTAFFISLFLSIILACFLIAGSVVVKRADFKINESTKRIVVGHSHPECAYNDSIINAFKNLAISGESYYYTFPKVKNIIKQNPQIETVFIEFTNNQITKNVEEWIWGDKYLSYYFAIYSPFIPIHDLLVVLKNRPKEFLANLPVVMKDILKKCFKHVHYPSEYGGYKQLTGTLEEYVSEPIKKNEDFVVIDNEKSTLQVNYLTSIISFLNKNNIDVILIRTPQHHTYQGYENDSIYHAILNQNFSKCQYIDLSTFPLEQIHFRDSEHLNELGAQVVSHWLNTLLSKDIKAVFIRKPHTSYSEIMQQNL